MLKSRRSRRRERNLLTAPPLALEPTLVRRPLPLRSGLLLSSGKRLITSCSSSLQILVLKSRRSRRRERNLLTAPPLALEPTLVRRPLPLRAGLLLSLGKRLINSYSSLLQIFVLKSRRSRRRAKNLILSVQDNIKQEKGVLKTKNYLKAFSCEGEHK